MNAQYGCQISNRYTAYLDSSDYGNAAVETNQKKRKSKKKRKPKQPKYVDKAVNTEGSFELSDQFNNSDGQYDENVRSIGASDNDDQPIYDECEKITITSEVSTQVNTSFDSGKCTESTNDGKTNSVADQSMKWSEICFEEERQIKMQSKQENSADEIKDVQTVSFADSLEKCEKIYPTLYYYNSNYRGYYRAPEYHQPINPVVRDSKDDAVGDGGNNDGASIRKNLRKKFPRNKYTNKSKNHDSELE